jgi:hypothetical protein
MTHDVFIKVFLFSYTIKGSLILCCICVDLQVTIQYFILTFYVKFLKIVLNCTYIHVLYFYDLFHILLSSD